MSQPYQIAYLPWNARWEGNVPWMYLDSCKPGNVTCGRGFLLETALVAQGFAWYHDKVCTLPALPSDVTVEWNRVKAMPAGRVPGFYAPPAALMLKQADIDAHLMAELDRLDSGLAAGIPRFEELLDGWKMALLDVAYNLGLEGLLKGYPKMLRAVQVGNGPLAAAECPRKGIGAARNAWCAALFSGQTAETA